MITIHKYTLEITDDQQLALPKGSRVTGIAEQRGRLCLWAVVDTNQEPTKVHIKIFGTGHPIKPEYLTSTFWSFYGTVLVGKFVWHVFGDIGKLGLPR